MKNTEDNIVADKSYHFACRTIRACKYLRENTKEFVLTNQFLRSGTAIGALVRESRFAQSRKDFINKMHIALKEANETEYWIKLLHESGHFDDKSYKSIWRDCDELIRLLASIVKTTKETPESAKPILNS